MLAAGLVLLALVGGVIGTTLGCSRRNGQERIAVRRRRGGGGTAAKPSSASGRRSSREGEEQKQLAEANAKQADEEKQIAQAVRDFLQHKLLGQADTRKQADALLRAGASSSAAVPNPTIRELLDRAAAELSPEKIEESFPGNPAASGDPANGGRHLPRRGRICRRPSRSCSARPPCTGSNSAPTTPTR